VIVILGGGVAGASLAWGLARRGRRDVVVFDPRPPGQGSTGAALGGFRTQHGSALNIGLSLASRPWFADRADRVSFQPNGYLYLAEDDAVAAELTRRADLQRSNGLPIEHPDPASLVPFLDASGYRGTNFCGLDGVYLPAQILATFVEEAQAAGAEFRYETPASAGDLESATSVAVCAGIWSGEVGRELGVRLAVEPLERVVWDVGTFKGLRPVPVTLEAGTGYHFREREGSLLLMGPGDQHDWTHFREWLALRVPAAAVERPVGHWTGCYEVTFDHHPLVGATERAGVWSSCGFSGHGVMHAPVIGDALAAMILGDSPAVDIAALSPLRKEPLVDVTQL
jgi:sarcosine oxidase, subunit beta